MTICFLKIKVKKLHKKNANLKISVFFMSFKNGFALSDHTLQVHCFFQKSFD